MIDLYKADEYCMAFSNETIKEYLIDKIMKIPRVKLDISFCEKQICQSDKVEKINRISFDKEKKLIFISLMNR